MSLSQRYMRCAHGYVLLELLISLVISAAIAMALFSSFFQMRKALMTTEYFSDVYDRAVVVYRQVSRDLGGAFVPIAARDEKKTDADKQNKTGNEQKTAQRDDREKKQPSAQATDKKRKPLADIFIGTQKGGMLEQFSCITCNPLQVYWSDLVGKAKPRIARVVYRLVKQPGDPVSYALTRQESYDTLELDAFKPGREKPIRQLTVIDGIKSCTLVYTAVVTQQKSGDRTGGSKKKTYSYIDATTWQLSEKERKKKGIVKPYPDIVQMNLELWDERKVQATPFTFLFSVHTIVPVAFEREDVQEEPLFEKEQEQKQAKQSQQQQKDGQKKNDQARKNQARQGYIETMNKLERFTSQQ